MMTLADFPFEDLQAGMRFRHPDYGEQVILDLGRGALGPVIRFHDCNVYSGSIPELNGEDEEGGQSLFQLLAGSIYPAGAEEWIFSGHVEGPDAEAHGWKWFISTCPHCGFNQFILAVEKPWGGRSCRVCGMPYSRPVEACAGPNKFGGL